MMPKMMTANALALVLLASGLFFISGRDPVLAENEPALSTTTDYSFDAIEKLVQEYYPRAKITKSGKGIHFEFKVKKEMSIYLNRPVAVPSDGGILGDLLIKEGEYTEKDKNLLPSEERDGYHTTLTMAPYSSVRKRHLLAKLVYPQDVPADFHDRFKQEVAAFNTGESTEPIATSTLPSKKVGRSESPPAVAATSAGSDAQLSDRASTMKASDAKSSDAKTSDSSTSEHPDWHLLKPDGMRFSVRVPQAMQPKVEKHPSGLTSYFWNMEYIDSRYVVNILKYPPNMMNDEQIMRMLADSLSDKKSKPTNPLHDIVLNGRKGKEQLLPATSNTNARRILCFATSGYGYMFLAGYPGKIKGNDEFFNSIKIEDPPELPWTKISQEDAHLEFSFPAENSVKEGSDEKGSGKSFVGSSKDGIYCVGLNKLKKPCRDAAAQDSELNRVAATVLKQGAHKLEKSFLFQNLKAREYSFTTEKGPASGKVIVCMSDSIEYLFMTTATKEEARAKFFDNVKIGK